jgi:hypothetical protein
MNSFCVSIPPIVQEPQAQYELLREQRLNAEPGESRNGVPDTCQRILFADFQGFAILAEQAEPAALVGLLDQYFTAFDDIVARHGMEKLKTIGDAYMAVGGVPKSNRRHPIDACLTALEMQAAVARIKLRTEKMKLPALDLRVGIHTGPVISGVVGNRRFSFDTVASAGVLDPFGGHATSGAPRRGAHTRSRNRRRVYSRWHSTGRQKPGRADRAFGPNLCHEQAGRPPSDRELPEHARPSHHWSSSLATRLLSEDLVTCSTRAAALNPVCSTTLAKAKRSLRSCVSIFQCSSLGNDTFSIRGLAASLFLISRCLSEDRSRAPNPVRSLEIAAADRRHAS